MAKANLSSMIIDFDDIEESSGTRVRVSEGDYPARVKAVKFATSQAGNPMLVFTIQGTGGKFEGKELLEYCALTKKALWKLRDLMVATGVKLPKKQDIRALLNYVKKNVVGKDIGVTLGDDEFVNDKGKSIISSKIQDYMDVDDVGTPRASEEDDDDIEEEDDDFDSLTRSELKALIREHDLEITVKKSTSDDDLREAVREAMADDDEDEDGEDEDDEDEDDGLDELDRAGLKAHIKANKLDVKVLKSMDDDAIRAAIRESGDDEEIEDIDLDEI